jgi:hypothetical protein
MALYVVRVPQTGALPTASFRFHLAMDTLAVQLMVATADSIAEFHYLKLLFVCQAHTITTFKEGGFLRINKYKILSFSWI